MSYTIYHNTRCKKSRSGLQYLIQKGIEPTIVEYLKDPIFTIESLTKLIQKLNIKPIELIRTQEEIYKKNYKGKNLSNEQWISVLVKNPKLIRRPIVEKGEQAVVGDEVENISALF